ncbi:MAG TPA: DUF2652 domain-containing protein [Nitriliruptorales bacterium]|nr:DUF2652 domain-containing protein [Nitriliruptorales bacterium]
MSTTVSASTDHGCLLVADISGYTSYLMGSELDHAQDVLGDLMETVVRALEATFRVSKLEGDAAFAYAVVDRIDASMLLDTIDACYFTFRARLRDVDRATSCDCNACVLIPHLDLKVIVHHGAFARRKVAGSEELTGRDVILVHRLLKNSVSETFGVRGYALLTDACVDAMGIDPEPLGYRRHVERYDDLGTVSGYVGDLEERWLAEQERRRVYVTPADAAFEVTSGVFTAPPEVVWEFLTVPERRALWGADRVDQVAGGARRGVGTTNHCIHGKDVIVEHLLDWRPFRYYTVGYTFPLLGDWYWTLELEPVDEGTRVHVRPVAYSGRRAVLIRLFRRKVERDFAAAFERLGAVLDRELATV